MIKKILLSLTMIGGINLSCAANDMEDGYQYQANVINALLEKNALILDKTYDFQDFKINYKFFSYVVCKDKDSYEIIISEIKQDMQCETVLYPKKIVDQNKNNKEIFTWRNILLFPSKKMSINLKVNEDFKLGIEKANNQLKNGFITLTKMHEGMILYKSLKSTSIVNK